MYRVRNLDAPRTMEDQMSLLASAAREVLDAWSAQVQKAEAPYELQGPMQRLNRQLTETDVFMSGYLAPR